MKNCNDVCYKKDATFAKRLQNLGQSNAEMSKDLKVHQSDIKSINLLEKTNEVTAQFKQKIAENAKRIKQNLKEVDTLNKIRVELFEKYRQVSHHARQMI